MPFGPRRPRGHVRAQALEGHADRWRRHDPLPRRRVDGGRLDALHPGQRRALTFLLSTALERRGHELTASTMPAAVVAEGPDPRPRGDARRAQDGGRPRRGGVRRVEGLERAQAPGRHAQVRPLPPLLLPPPSSPSASLAAPSLPLLLERAGPTRQPVPRAHSPSLSLRRFQSLIRENHDELARSIVLEQGKTFADAKGDVLRGLQVRPLDSLSLRLGACAPSPCCAPTSEC